MKSGKNIFTTQMTEEPGYRGGTFRYMDLSGERLGVRIEDLAPGDTSSFHHFHTAEEEHVIALSGEATLILGEEALPVEAGDHLWFRAGEQVAHHLHNTSAQTFRFLVFGERNPDDVVFYPEHQVVLVKKNGVRQFTYRPIPPAGQEGND